MDDKPYHIGIFWGSYSDIHDRPEVLMSFRNQKELDDFTKKFENDEELRSFFEQDIGESALENIAKIRKNETKYGHFLGRISAYYIDKNNRLNFVKVAYKNRKIIRDYHELYTLEERKNFLETVFRELEKKLSYESKKRSINDKMFIIIKTFEKYSYYISDNEKYYLKVYLNSKKEEDKLRLFGFIKINLQEELEEDKDNQMLLLDIHEQGKYELYDLSDEEFGRIFEKAVRTNNFDELFQSYSSEEIAKKCNYYEIQGKRRRKNYV